MVIRLVRSLKIEDSMTNAKCACAASKAENGAVSKNRCAKNQLAKRRIEQLEFSRTAAATLPKNRVSPAGRPTPMTIKL